MYTIIDVETSGGKFREEKIIEIALYNFDGHQITDSFSTLLNPEKEIHFFVAKLTGISQKMVKRAPKFHEVAKRIVEMCDGNILVAHNAEFDYRMLRQEFQELGYPFRMETLCTLELAKKFIPNLKSYALGNLCKSLGIPLLDAHRAFGDAKATVELLQLLLEKDSSKKIQQKSPQLELELDVPSKLQRFLDELPMKTGVYYFHNAQGDIIYVGKSINIKNRIRQHFTSKHKRSLKMQQLTEKITYEITGSELVALIKESVEIKAMKPVFNRSQRKTVFQYGYYIRVDSHDYKCISIEKIHENESPIVVFSSLAEAKNVLYKITEKYQLCQKINKLYPHQGSCFQYKVQDCFGACVQKESTEIYNQRVQQFVDSISYQNNNIIVQDKGRKPNEKSFIVIENGMLTGYGFYNYFYQIESEEKRHKRMISVVETQDLKRIVKNNLLKYPKKELVVSSKKEVDL